MRSRLLALACRLEAIFRLRSPGRRTSVILASCSNGHINLIISSLIGLADEVRTLAGWLSFYLSLFLPVPGFRMNNNAGIYRNAEKEGFPSLYTAAEFLPSSRRVYKIGPRSCL